MHDLFEIPEVHQFMHLFKQMTQPDAIHRITPDKAYDKYIELEEMYLGLYLQGLKKDKKDKKDKKGKKRTKRRSKKKSK